MTIHPIPHQSALRRHGFTLIELLVVITIISILIAVTIPIYKMVSDGSNSARSLTHLKTIGTVLSSYTSENDNQLPAVENETGLDWTDISIDLDQEDLDKLPHWTQALIHHAADNDADVSRKVFTCPGLRWKNGQGKKMKFEDVLLAYGVTEAMFGFDEDGDRSPLEQRSVATIENKPRTIMMIETKQQGSQETSYPVVTWREASADFNKPKPADSNKVDFRFKKAVNALMADGSVRSFRSKDKADVQEPNWSGEDYDRIE